MTYQYFDQLSAVSKARYQQKIQISNLQMCPYRLPASVWINNPTEWPEIGYYDIHHYLVETPGPHTKEAMQAYKSLESYKLVEAGWVQTVRHLKTGGSGHNITVFKADVVPSFRVNDTPHHPWVAAADSGAILAAHCDCKAGLGESCSHVGAILFKLEMAVRLGLRKRACTDEACQWNSVAWNGVQPAPLSRIMLYSEDAKSKVSKGLIRRAPPLPPSDDKQEEFLLNLLRCKSGLPVCLSLFSSTAMNLVPKLPPAPCKRMPVDLTTWKSKACPDPLQEIAVTLEQLAYLEEETRKQSESLLWHQMRAGRITASIVHAVLRTNQDVPAPSLLSRLVNPSPRPLQTEPVLWGRQHEKDATDDYIDFMCEHGDFSLQPSGLRLSMDSPFLGASPDGIVSCACCGSGLVEVKCPYTYRNVSINEMVREKDSCLDSNFNLKRMHAYYDQVQLQMYVTNSDYVDFVVWTTCDSNVCRVYPDEVWQSRALPLLKLFWKNHVVPALCSETLPSPSEPAGSVHCKCGKEDGGDMVGCDDDNCKHQWFHWKCVGLRNAPRTKTWYCVDCKPRKKARC